MSETAVRRQIAVGAVDDHPLMLAGLRLLLSDLAPEITLAVEAGTVHELLASGTRCDVVLLDLRLGDDSNPGDNVAALLAAGRRVLIYTEGVARSMVSESIRAGAHGILRKDRTAEELVEAIRWVVDGDSYPNAELAQALSGVSELQPHLSDREREALALYASGLPTKSVARRLGVGIESAREYLKRVRSKYEKQGRPAYTRMDMYRRAVEDGIVDPIVSD